LGAPDPNGHTAHRCGRSRVMRGKPMADRKDGHPDACKSKGKGKGKGKR
jgi:hypothetical protein